MMATVSVLVEISRVQKLISFSNSCAQLIPSFLVPSCPNPMIRSPHVASATVVEIIGQHNIPFVASFSGFACKFLLPVVLFLPPLFDWKQFIALLFASKRRVFVGSLMYHDLVRVYRTSL